VTLLYSEQGPSYFREVSPLLFESKKFSPAERNYTTGEQELAAIVYAMRI
jgi:hypothetical protein